MADNVTLNAGSGGDTIAADDDGVAKHQYVKVEFGGDNTQTPVQDSAPLPVEIGDGTDQALVSGAGALIVDGSGVTQPVSIAATVSVDASGTAVPVTDNAGSLTVDNTTLDNAHSADFDTGAGTDTTPAFGIAVPASGGAAVVPGDATAGLKVDLGTDNDVTVTSGSITETNSTAILADTASMDTNLATVAGAVAGTEMQVDVVAPLPAGTNNIGDVDIASSVALDVSAATVTVDLGANNDVTVQGEDAENAPATAAPVQVGGRYDSIARTLGDGDVGAIALDADGAVQVSDGGNSLTVDGTVAATQSGTWSTRTQDGSGNALTSATRGAEQALSVQIVDGSGAQVTTFGGAGGTSEVDDADFTQASTSGTPAMGVYESTPTSVTDGDLGVVGIDVNRQLKVVEASASSILADTSSMDTNLATVAGAVAGTEMQVDVVTSALPSGAATAANQSTANTALSAIQTSVETIDNAIAGTEMQVDIVSDGAGLATSANQPAVYVDDTSTHATGTSEGNLLMAAATPTDSAVDANDIGAVAMSTDRRLLVDAQVVGQDTTLTVTDDGTAILVDGSAVTQPVSGTVTANLSATDNAVLDQIELNTSYGDATGGGTEAGALRVTIASDSTGTLTVDNAGTFATQATLQANSGVDIGDVDVTSISAGSNLIGDVGLSGARTSGGTTLYKNIDVDETEDAIKASAGQLYWIHAVNLSANPLYLKFYNATVASVIVGTTTPDLTFPIPTQGDTNGAGFTLSIPNGIAFDTAITIAATTGVADADTGAPGTNACVVNLGYA